MDLIFEKISPKKFIISNHAISVSIHLFDDEIVIDAQ